jgi:hypothetical protein
MRPTETQPLYAHSDMTGGDRRLHRDLRETYSFLSEPSTLVLFDEDIRASASPFEQRLERNVSGLRFSYALTDSQKTLLAGTGAELGLSQRSVLAQIGLDPFLNDTALPDQISGKFVNVGANTVLVPAHHPLALGTLYMASREVFRNESEIQSAITLFREANAGRSKNGNATRFGSVESQFTHTMHETLMTIETPEILVGPAGGVTVYANDDLRGTNRAELHDKVLRLTKLQYPDPRTTTPAEVHAYLKEIKSQFMESLDWYYSLTQMKRVITYPDGWALIIKGGVIVDEHDNPVSWIDHSASVVGKGQDNLPHRLLSEFFHNAYDLVERILIHRQRIAIACRPVRLLKTNRFGVPV